MPPHRLESIPLQSDVCCRRTVSSSPQPEIRGAAERKQPAQMAWKKLLQDYREKLIIVFAPLLLLPLVFTPGTTESKCLFVVLLMAVYWLFEVLPLAVTALIPIALYPMLGVLSAEDTCKSYMPDVNFLSFGGLVIALAVEKCNLHQRIALRVLTWVGSKPNWILLGFMGITGFLSMWMSNTAATAMMLPIVQSVVKEFKNSSQQDEYDSENGMMINSLTKGKAEPNVEEGRKTAPKSEEESPMNPEVLSFGRALLIGISYSSSLGGTGTLTGTPTNLVMTGLISNLFPMEKGQSINYALWMLFSVPVMATCLLLTWLVLQFYFLGVRLTLKNLRCGSSKAASEDKVTKMFEERYASLPPTNYAEKSVLTLFSILVLMWVFRDLGIPGFSGFGVLFKPRFYSDGTSAIFITILLFILPNEKPAIFGASSRTEEKTKNGRPGTLMDWKTISEKFPWNVVLLLGGGFGLAAGVKSSGLSTTIGNLLSMFGGLPVFALQLMCVLMATIMTNIASNVVIASILIPVLATMTQNAQINPVALILPTTIASSYAFMLPAGTPSNAIVFAPGMLRLKDMVGAGFFVSMACVVFLVLHCQTLASLYMNLDQFPAWAAPLLLGNLTAPAV